MITFNGDYEQVVGDNKAIFLSECTAELQVTCTDVHSGSIVVTVSGSQAEVDAALRLFREAEGSAGHRAETELRAQSAAMEAQAQQMPFMPQNAPNVMSQEMFQASLESSEAEKYGALEKDVKTAKTRKASKKHIF